MWYHEQMQFLLHETGKLLSTAHFVKKCFTGTQSLSIYLYNVYDCFLAREARVELPFKIANPLVSVTPPLNYLDEK